MTNKQEKPSPKIEHRLKRMLTWFSEFIKIKTHLIPILYMMIWLDLLQRHLIVQVKVIGRMVIKGVDR
jgi:hypothetical protein